MDLELVAGQWPDDISGEFVASTPYQTGNLPYAIFDNGGMVRLSLQPGTFGAAPGKFAWRAREWRSPSKVLMEKCPEAFLPGPIGYSGALGPPNSGNTAPLPWGDRLFATWDAGRPVEVDPNSLEYMADVGSARSWGGSTMASVGGPETILPFIFSSAHPIADPERDCLWTVKIDFVLTPNLGQQPSVVRFDRADGTHVKRWPLEGVTFEGAVHQLAQTRDWVILADSGNFKGDPGEMAGGERTVQINEEAPVWMVRKDVLEATPSGTPVTPVCFTIAPTTGHFYGKYDDSDGVQIVFEGMDLMDLGFFLKPDDRDAYGDPVDPAHAGLYNMAMSNETLWEVVFDPDSGKTLEKARFKEDWTWNLQLSGMDWSTEGLENPTLHHVVYQGCRPHNFSERAIKCYSDRYDAAGMPGEQAGSLASFERGSLALKSRYEYASVGDYITSPSFAPRDLGSDSDASTYAGGEPGGHDGYVIVPILNDDGFRVDLFDAARVGDGPVATLAAPDGNCVPLILHSAWMPTSPGPSDAVRMPFTEDLSDDLLAALPDDMRAAVDEVAEDFG